MNEDNDLNGEVLEPVNRVGTGKEATNQGIEAERVVLGDRLEYAKMMADMLACAPNVERVREWANKYPDRYFYSLKLMGGMVGLAERVEHHGTIVHAVAAMSDSEIIAKLEQMKMTVQHSLVAATPKKQDEPPGT